MQSLRYLLAAFVLAMGASVSSGQVLKPVKWAFSTEASGGKTYLVYSATIAPGWNVYSQYLESDDGPVATEITYEDKAGATLVGKSIESGGKDAGFDEVFRMNVTKFHNSYVIRQEVSGMGANPITGYLTYMVCDKTQCLPPGDVEFSLSAPKAVPAPNTPNTPTTTKPATTPGRVDVTPETIPSTASAKTPGRDVGNAYTPTGGPAPAGTASANTPAATVSAATARLAARPTVRNEGIIRAPVARATDTDPVVWHFETTVFDDTTYLVTAIASIAKGWNIYAQDSNEDGPIPTSFSFDESPAYRLIGDVKEVGKRKAGMDEVFGVKVAKLFGPEVRFEQRVALLQPDARIEGYLEYMSCDQSQCLPPEDVNFAYAPEVGIAKSGLFSDVAALPVIEGTAQLAPVSNGTDPISRYVIDDSAEGATCGNDNQAAVSVTAADGNGIIFLLGFGGGLLALLTPCVFPMIPLTVSFFTSRGKDRKRGFRRALLYGASIIVIYVGLGLLVTAVFGADALNSFSTNPWVNIAFAVLFVVFALSFFGIFELQLPSAWANKADRAADQGGFLGIFFMAFTLSLVSFSCTGPIIGTLLVETASGGGATIFGRVPVAPLVGMFGFALALALPFTLFALFPSALSSLPKSGGWMDKVKVTLGILEIAFAMKFLSTADLILNTKWMPYELFLSIWVLCALGLAVYYYRFGDLRKDLASGDKQWSRTNLGFSLVALGLAVYLGMGYRYNDDTRTFETPNVLSGLAPPAGHSYIYPKDCPRDFDCFKDYEEGLAYAKSVDKPILLDFTGHGCVNCRRMEDQVWGQPGVHERIKQDYVLISLYVDEREELAEPFVSDFSGRKLRTVGNKWADFQARAFDRNSQPYYVLLSPDQKVLNQPVPYTPDVAEYAAFLDCGLEQFERLNGKGALGSVE